MSKYSDTAGRFDVCYPEGADLRLAGDPLVDGVSVVEVKHPNEALHLAVAFGTRRIPYSPCIEHPIVEEQWFEDISVGGRKTTACFQRFQAGYGQVVVGFDAKVTGDKGEVEMIGGYAAGPSEPVAKKELFKILESSWVP